MELTDLIMLVKAGYTKDEILQMESPVINLPDAVPEQKPVPAPAQAAEPVPAQAVEPVTVAEPQPEQKEPTMADLMMSIAKLTSAVQANAIAQSVIPGGMTNPPSAEDMLAEIIRPTIKERDNA